MCNKIYLYSTFYFCIQQYTFSFNFNPNYFHSTKIFVQLQPKIISFTKNNYSASTKSNFIQQIQPKLFSFNKNNYSTSTKNNFIQQESSRTFKISSFNKTPRPSPVKYKTTLSHVSNISKSSQIHNWETSKLRLWHPYRLSVVHCSCDAIVLESISLSLWQAFFLACSIWY